MMKKNKWIKRKGRKVAARILSTILASMLVVGEYKAPVMAATSEVEQTDETACEVEEVMNEIEKEENCEEYEETLEEKEYDENKQEEKEDNESKQEEKEVDEDVERKEDSEIERNRQENDEDIEESEESKKESDGAKTEEEETKKKMVEEETEYETEAIVVLEEEDSDVLKESAKVSTESSKKFKQLFSKVGDSATFSTGAFGKLLLPAGEYTFEAWGAGGAASICDKYKDGGNGGYVSGKFSFETEKEIEYQAGTGGECKKGNSYVTATPGGGASYYMKESVHASSGGGGGYSAISSDNTFYVVAGGGGGAEAAQGFEGRNGGSGGEYIYTSSSVTRSSMRGTDGKKYEEGNKFALRGGGGGGYPGGSYSKGGDSMVAKSASNPVKIAGKGAAGGKRRGEKGEDGKIKITWNACSHLSDKKYQVLDEKFFHTEICGDCGKEIAAHVECMDENVDGKCDQCGRYIQPYFAEEESQREQFTYHDEGECVLHVTPQLIDGYTVTLQWYQKKGDQIKLVEGANEENLKLDKKRLEAGEYEYYCELAYQGFKSGKVKSVTHNVLVEKADVTDFSWKEVPKSIKYTDGEQLIAYTYDGIGEVADGKLQVRVETVEQENGREVFKAELEADRKAIRLIPQYAGSACIILSVEAAGNNYKLPSDSGFESNVIKTALIKVTNCVEKDGFLWVFEENEDGTINITDVKRVEEEVIDKELIIPEELMINGIAKKVSNIDKKVVGKIITNGVSIIEVNDLAFLEEKDMIGQLENEVLIRTPEVSFILKKDNNNRLVIEQYYIEKSGKIIIVPKDLQGIPIISVHEELAGNNTERIEIKGKETKLPENMKIDKEKVEFLVIKDSQADEDGKKIGIQKLHYVALGGIKVEMSAKASSAVVGNKIDHEGIKIIAYWDKEKTKKGALSWDELTEFPENEIVGSVGNNKYIIGYYDAYTYFVVNGYAPVVKEQMIPTKEKDDGQDKPEKEVSTKPNDKNIDEKEKNTDEQEIKTLIGTQKKEEMDFKRKKNHTEDKNKIETKQENGKNILVQDEKEWKDFFDVLVSNVEKNEIERAIDTNEIQISKEEINALYKNGYENLAQKEQSKLIQSNLIPVYQKEVEVKKNEKILVEKSQSALNREKSEASETYQKGNSTVNHWKSHRIIDKIEIVVIVLAGVGILAVGLYGLLLMKKGKNNGHKRNL